MLCERPAFQGYCKLPHPAVAGSILPCCCAAEGLICLRWLHVALRFCQVQVTKRIRYTYQKIK